MDAYRTLNPATEACVKEFPTLSWTDAEATLATAEQVFEHWRLSSFTERTLVLNTLAEALRADAENLAQLITMEMGKPISESKGEVEKCALVCEYYAKFGQIFLSNEEFPTDGSASYVQCDPLGVILGIMPWNFPLWQVFRWAAPTIMAGNAVILKHAPNVPQCALAIEKLFQLEGIPRGLFQSVFVSNADAAQIIGHRTIRGVSLTGSTRAGKSVAETAGRHLKKVVLELGGSDPFIVLADAPLEQAVEWAVRSRMLNAGQSCIAAKRFIVVENVASAFTSGITEIIRSLHTGDPADAATHIGPLARQDLRENLVRQVNATVAEGATAKCGGAAMDGKGFFYEPTVLTGVESTMTTCTEETFGPVASIIVVKNDEEAIRMANHTEYGLGASIWSANVERAQGIAYQIDAGAVFINGMVKSDPRLPFGGIKQSGFGRELGAAGIREFVNLKTIWVGT